MSVFGLSGHCNKRVKTHFQADSEKIELDLKFNGEQLYDSGILGSLEIFLWLESEEGEIIDELEYITNEFYSQMLDPIRHEEDRL